MAVERDGHNKIWKQEMLQELLHIGGCETRKDDTVSTTAVANTIKVGLTVSCLTSSAPLATCSEFC